MGRKWNGILHEKGFYSEEALAEVLRELSQDQKIGEWEELIAQTRLHPPLTWGALQSALVMESHAPLMWGKDFMGTEDDATMVFTGGAMCSIEEHGELEQILLSKGLLSFRVGKGPDGIWYAALGAEGTDTGKMRDLKRRVIGSMRGTYDNTPAVRAGYDTATGGDFRGYITQLSAGTETRIHPICLYHISKVLGGSVDVWTPHMLVPMRFAWSAADEGNTVSTIAWAHQTRHGHLNHFWRTVPLAGEMLDGGSAANVEEGVAEQAAAEQGDEKDVRLNQGWDWEDRRKNLRPDLMARLIEQHPNSAEVCSTDGTPLLLSVLTHRTLEEATVGGQTRVVRRRTDD